MLTINVNNDRLFELNLAIKRLRAQLLPDEVGLNGGFFMQNPHTLYVDEDIDNDTVGQLDKAVCCYINSHEVLEKWEEARRRKK